LSRPNEESRKGSLDNPQPQGTLEKGRELPHPSVAIGHIPLPHFHPWLHHSPPGQLGPKEYMGTTTDTTGHDFYLMKYLKYFDPEKDIEFHGFRIEFRYPYTKLYEAKKYLLVLLFQKAYNKTRIRAVFKFIDWIMRLPEQLEKRIEEDILREQGEKPMAYVTSWERRAEKRGEEKGWEKGREEARKETAKRMLQEGWDIDDINRLTGLELEKIRELE
jgi:hypothetical protein